MPENCRTLLKFNAHNISKLKCRFKYFLAEMTRIMLCCKNIHVWPIHLKRKEANMNLTQGALQKKKSEIPWHSQPLLVYLSYRNSKWMLLWTPINQITNVLLSIWKVKKLNWILKVTWALPYQSQIQNTKF